MLIQKDISLESYNTFQINAKAKFFVEIKNIEDIESLISNDVRTHHPHIIIGEGANILFTKDYEGLVVKISIKGRELTEELGFTYVKVGAGEEWHETMMRILDQGLVGCENLVYIPGLVGAAPVGNIGAYGKEAKDIIFAVEGIELRTGERKVLSNADCHFGYRDSIFKHELKDSFLITSVILQAQKDSAGYRPDTEYKDIKQEMEKRGLAYVSGLDVANLIIEIRKNKLPDRHTIGTAGSFFKNPVITKKHYDKLLEKYPTLIGREIIIKSEQPSTLNSQQPKASTLIKLSAGQLIELAGFKGYREGPVGVSPNHALILLNYGGATGPQLVHLAELIQKKVLEQFDVQLEPEVLYV